MKTTLIVTLILGGMVPWTMRAQSFADLAPVVVKTVPEAGSLDVPPGEFEIKVTFNHEMKDRSWSWCTVWDNSTPEADRPRYEADHKTCVIKVKLESGKTYGYWLNSENFHHFQDREGRPAVPYLLVFSTRGGPSSLIGQSQPTNGIGAVHAEEEIAAHFAAPVTEPNQEVVPADAIETTLACVLTNSLAKREAGLNRIERTIPAKDIPAALNFLARKGETGKHSLFASLAAKWASQDANAAVAWATNQPDADTRKSAVVSVLKGWTDNSPKAAATFATTLPAGELQDAALEQVAGEWGFRDSAGAAEWVSHFPKGAVRDKALGPIIFWGQGQAPAAIIEMLETIGDPDLIQQNCETVASIWLQRDDTAARAWIKKSALSEEVKQRLLNSSE